MVLSETASAAKSATWSNARRGRPLNKGERKDLRWAMGLEASSRPGDHMHGINLHGVWLAFRREPATQEAESDKKAKLSRRQSANLRGE